MPISLFWNGNAALLLAISLLADADAGTAETTISPGTAMPTETAVSAGTALLS